MSGCLPPDQRRVILLPLNFIPTPNRQSIHLIRFHGVLVPNPTLQSQIVPGGQEYPQDPSEDHDASHPSTRARLSWAQLLKRVFSIDMASCPHCGGPLTIIAAIEDSTVIAKILAHLGFPTRAPPRSPTRTGELFQTA